MAEYPKMRDLDGVYFRVERNGKWESISFSDLIPEEQDKVLEKWDRDSILRLAKILADTIRTIGDTLDIERSETDGR